MILQDKITETLIQILKDNNISFEYDGGWGGYIIYDDEQEEFRTVCKDDNELKDYIETNLGIELALHECYSCKLFIETYAYSHSIYYKNGEVEYTNEIDSNMTTFDMENLEKEIMMSDEEVDYVEFGTYCPHCLSCM